MTICTRRPSGVGSTTELVPSTGANWECVNETPADDADYVILHDSELIATEHDTYVHTGDPYPGVDDTINSVTVYCRAKHLSFAAGGGSYESECIRTHATDYYSTTHTLTTSWVLYSNTWTTNPFTGLPWIRGDIASPGLQFGTRLNSSNTLKKLPCTSQVYCEINYTPAGGGPAKMSVQVM